MTKTIKKWWWQEMGKKLAEDLDFESDFLKDTIYNAADTMLESIGITEDDEGPYEDFHEHLCDELLTRIKLNIIDSFD